MTPSYQEHLDQGTIVALRDEGPSDTWDQSHAAECATCVADLAEARSRSTFVAEALATLDLPVDMTAAKVATRTRLDRARSARPVSMWRKWPLGRAAAILLVAAGAVSALTSSPVRSWWTTSTIPVVETSEEVPPTAATAPPTSSIEVEVPDGRIDVVVVGPGAVSFLEVAWTDRATVRVVAPRGSAFTYADGRVQVDAAPGIVRAELPRTIPEAAVRVDGRLYVERSASGTEILEPRADITDDLIRFGIGAP